MSRIDWPRTVSGLCSPSAQRTASVMLDLPEPLGPTITLTPGENSSFSRSGNDLKTFISIDLTYIALTLTLALAPDAAQSLLCGRLLGGLLAPARAHAYLLGIDDRLH